MVRQINVGLIESRGTSTGNKAMQCPLCSHSKAYKHGKMPNSHQLYLCPACHQTFCESFDSPYYRRHVSPEQIRQVLQVRSEGSSLRGISRTSGLAYNTVVSIVRSASQKSTTGA